MSFQKYGVLIKEIYSYLYYAFPFAVKEEWHMLFLVFDTDLPEQNIKAGCLSI